MLWKIDIATDRDLGVILKDFQQLIYYVMVTHMILEEVDSLKKF